MSVARSSTMGRNRMMKLSMMIASFTCLATAAMSSAGVGIEPLKSDRIATGLAFPTMVTHAPGDAARLFIVEKKGVIKILNLASETVNATPFLNIDPIVVGGSSTNDEQGLLGLTFHPDYANNGYFFVYYTATSGGGDTVVARYKVSADPNIADGTSGVTIITFDQPQANHNGGWIDFGPDGMLYIATGDGGNANDMGTGHSEPTGNAQDLTSNRLGKILRLDVTGADGIPGTADDDDFAATNANYHIPGDNPFVGIAGDDEIWAYGVRNPWRCAFDRLTGELYIGDVGQNAIEEISYQPANEIGSMPGDAGYMGGRNYGWRCKEGNSCTGFTGCTCSDASLIAPIHTYNHPGGGSRSVTGGTVYRGCAIPSLQGTYFFAEYVVGTIWSFSYNGSSISNFAVRTAELSPSIDGFTANQIVNFGEDANGEIYMVDHGGAASGQIFKIIPATLTDCDSNGISDSCDIAAGAPDRNSNGVIDTCEAVPGDLNGDGNVDGADLGLLLAGWGDCPGRGDCVGDLDGSGSVDGADLGLLLSFWTV